MFGGRYHHTPHSIFSIHDAGTWKRRDEMAGRILPIALATIVGVSIGVATFDGEFKRQRQKRLQEEYDRYAQLSSFHFTPLTSCREVAAAAPPLKAQGPSSSATSAAPPPSPERLQGEKEAEASSSSWSSTLGLWAWKKEVRQKVAPAVVNETSSQDKGKP
jgi:hypothetical protein